MTFYVFIVLLYKIFFNYKKLTTENKNYFDFLNKKNSDHQNTKIGEVISVAKKSVEEIREQNSEEINNLINEVSSFIESKFWKNLATFTNYTVKKIVYKKFKKIISNSYFKKIIDKIIIEKIQEAKDDERDEKLEAKKKEKNLWKDDYVHNYENTQTKFIFEEIFKQKELDKKNIEFFIKALTKKEDLEDFKEELNYFIWKVLDFILFNNDSKLLYKFFEDFKFLTKKNIFEKKILKKLQNVVTKTQSELNYINIKLLIELFKNNSLDLFDEEFLDILAEKTIIQKSKSIISFLDIYEVIESLQSGKIISTFSRKIFEKNKEWNFLNKETISQIILKFKNFNSNEIDESLVQDYFEEFKNNNDEATSENITRFIYGLTMMDEKNISEEQLDYFFENLEDKNLDWYKLLKILSWLQNLPEKMLKDKYLNKIEKSIFEILDYISVTTARNILYWLKNLNAPKDYFIRVETWLFRVIEIENIDYLNSYDDFDFQLWKNLTDEERKDIVVLSIIQVYSIYWRKIPEKFLDLYDNAKNKNLSKISASEFFTFRYIKKFFPDAESSLYMNWFELDIFIPSENLNIEVDWIHHFWIKAMKDKIRDKNLKKLKNIIISRIKNSLELQNLSTKEEILNYLKNNES